MACSAPHKDYSFKHAPPAGESADFCVNQNQKTVQLKTGVLLTEQPAAEILTKLLGKDFSISESWIVCHGKWEQFLNRLKWPDASEGNMIKKNFNFYNLISTKGHSYIWAIYMKRCKFLIKSWGSLCLESLVCIVFMYRQTSNFLS